MDALAIAAEIRLRLGDRIIDPSEVMAEIERVVAERPEVDWLRVAIEYELMREWWPPVRVARFERARASGDPLQLLN